MSKDQVKEFHEQVLEARIPISIDDACLINQVEMMITGFKVNFPIIENATIDNIWSILPNHMEVLPHASHPEVLDILRIFFSHRMTLQSWRDLVHIYLQYDPALRLYNLHQQGYFYEKSPTIWRNRYQDYLGMLTKESIMKEEPEFPPFITKRDQNYYFFTYNSAEKERKYPLTKLDEQRIPRHLIRASDELMEKREEWLLPSGREKKERSTFRLPLKGNPWKETAKQMNEHIKKNASNYNDYDKKQLRDWMQAQSSFRLIPTRNDPYLTYKDTTGIAGIVGAGKTTFLMLELFRVTQLGAKSAVIAVNVVDMLLLVYRLYLVGIKAVPLIGKNATKHHLKVFIRKVKNEANRSCERNPLSQLAMEYVLEFFDGECLTGVLAGEDQAQPCVSLRKNDGKNSEKYACPLFTICGKYTIERRLREADVWVGTLSAFIHTKPLSIVNPLGKTYAELTHDEIDLIYIDEADSVQESADLNFVTENKIFGEEDAVFEAHFLKIAESLNTRYDLSSSRYQQNWRIHSSEANRVGHLIFALIKESQYVRNKIKNRTFGIHQLMGDITKAFFEVSSHTSISDHPFFRILRGIDLRSLSKSTVRDGERNTIEVAIKDYIQLMQDLRTYDDYEFKELKDQELEETKKLFTLIANRITESVTWKTHGSEEEKKDGYLLFQFFIYHLYFDDRFKYLIGIKKVVELLLNRPIEDLASSYRNLERYFPFVPEAATGRNFQYFYKESNKQGSVGTFRSYDYLGIGRMFLTRLGKLHENVSDQQGPALCFMSGTSFAEGSYHFHVNVSLDYLLESTAKKQSVIHQFIYPVYANGQPIFISGERDEKVKVKKLRLMAEKLVPKIKEELILLSKENRKVLLVVNSYKQAQVVQEELEKYFPNKVKALTNQIIGQMDEDFVLRGEVEYFADLEADILIVPLLSINRGYNILQQGKGESLFGSVFFMVRPYIPSDSIGNIIQVINGSVPLFKKMAISKGFQFYDAVLFIRKCSNRLLNHMLLEEQEWSILDDVERKAMSWYMFINVWQMIGRLLRGQTDARVYYVDAPFAWEHAKKTGKKETLQSSMLRNWVSILEEPSSNPEAKNKLYGEFLRGLKEALSLGKES